MMLITQLLTMRRSNKRGALALADFAVLGLLCEQPRHGYDLARRLAPDQDLGLVCPLNAGTVYFVLGRLQARGLIAAHRDDSGYPPRSVFQPTPPGRRAFEEWLREPVRRIRELKHDFLVKAYFASRRRGRKAAALLDALVDACERYLETVRAERAAVGGDGFARLVVESKLIDAESTLAWLLRERGAVGAGTTEEQL